MIKNKFLLMALCFIFVSNSYAYQKENEISEIKQLLNEYVESNGTNFVLSSEANGKVYNLDANFEKMSSIDLLEIFNQNGLVAIERHDAIYIFTKFEVDNLGKGFGPLWQG